MYKIVFSATGRTMAVADIMCDHDAQLIDLSRQNFQPIELTENDLCVVAAPVFGGVILEIAAQNILKIKANGAKAVLVAVFGNRAYDNALAHLKDICKKAGFVCIAACAPIAQHSVMPAVAADRPDEADKAKLTEFMAKIKSLYAEGTLPADVTVPGNVPEKGASGMPVHPKADGSCIKCGKCAALCPVSAIPQDNPQLTDKDKCITCMRCVEICPQNSRKMMPGVMKIVTPLMKKLWSKHIEIDFFIV